MLDAAGRRRLRLRAERFGWLLRGLTAIEIAMCVGLVVWAGNRVWRDPSASNWTLFAICVVLLVVGEGLTLWNRRGTWRPVAHTTRGFVELGILRARRKLRTTQIVPPFLAFELALILPWKWWQMTNSEKWAERMPEAFWPVLGMATALSAAFLASLAWWRRRVLAELADLEALSDALVDE